MILQFLYGGICMISGVLISIASITVADIPITSYRLNYINLSEQCVKRTIDDNLMVICPNSVSSSLRLAFSE